MVSMRIRLRRAEAEALRALLEDVGITAEDFIRETIRAVCERRGLLPPSPPSHPPLRLIRR